MIRQLCFLLVLLPLGIAAQTPAVTCASGTNAVQEGQSITCTSTAPVSWSLSGVGTISNQTSTSVTYTAPASIAVQHQMGGCMVLPNDSVFNTRIDNLPTNSTTALWAANIGSLPFSFGEAWGISLADNSTPIGAAKSFYGSTIFSNLLFPVEPAIKREGGGHHSLFDGGDHHEMIVRHTDCTFADIYNQYLNNDAPTNGCADGTLGCNVQGAIQYPWSSYAIIGGTDAAGLPLAPLTLHLDEIKNGAVNHALRFTSCVGCIYYSTPLWPAVGIGGCSGSNVSGNPCSDSPPYGARFRLKSSFNISGYSQYAQVVLTALQRYGLILADVGSEQEVTVSADISDDPTVEAALREIGGIPLSNFEGVDESSLQFAANSLAVCPNGQTCSGAAQIYETPASQAIITATPTGSGSAVSTPIAIQGVTIGLKRPNLYMPAGTYTYQIPSWVNGTANQSVTWTLISGVGSITSGGAYTPPANTSGGTTATLKVTSAADANAVNYVYVTILPAGVNPTGSVRIDTGNYAYTDGSGNLWQPGYTGAEASSAAGEVDSQNWQNQGSIPEIGVYKSYAHTYDDDISYNLIVPNGNYKVRFMFGMTYDNLPLTMSTFPAKPYGNMELMAQGQAGAHNFSFAANQPAGYSQIVATASDYYLPAKVTNNEFQASVLGEFPQALVDVYGVCGACVQPSLNGLELIPDSSPAHWTIDTQQQTTLTPGSSLMSLATAGAQTEYGTAFYSSVPLYAVGVRFYKGANDTGTHTGSLWQVQTDYESFTEQSQFATATFSSESATGWQQVNFSTPVALTANQLYIASYNSPTGYTAFDPNGYVGPEWGFQSGTVRATQGANLTGAGFPTNKSANLYLVDPVLSASANGSNPFTLFGGTSGPPGQQLRLYQVDWYTGLSDAQWSIVSGPGSIAAATDAFGAPCALYTAPSMAPAPGSAVVIQAQSVSTPSVSAITTLYFTGSQWTVK